MSTQIESPVRELRSVTDSEIANAYRHCSAIVKRAAGNFYYAFLLLPREQRHGIHALYAFCRAGDDAADDPGEIADKHSALTRLRARLDLCYQGKYTDHLTLALTHTIDRFGLDRIDFDDLFQGIESDLTPAYFQNEDDQLLYCYRVASTVGLLCLKIFGVNGEEDRKFAVALGKGMQLTNILRDLYEDRERGRLYLPLSDLKLVGVDLMNLFQPDAEEKVTQLVAINSARARIHFNISRQSMPREHARELLAARAMGAIYETILTRIEKNPGSRKRVELSRMEKLAVVKGLATGAV